MNANFVVQMRIHGTMHYYILLHLDVYGLMLDEELIEVMATLRITDLKHWVFFACSNISLSD